MTKSKVILEIENAANFFEATNSPSENFLANQTSFPDNITDPVPRDESLARAEVILQGVIFALAVFGNAVVILVLTCRVRGKKLSRMNTMILHLSIADLFVAFFNILPQLIWDITYRFQGGDSLCKFVKYFQVVAMYASSYVLVSTALDRYLVICHPLSSQTWTQRYTHGLVAVAWLVSLLFSVPQLVIFGRREVSPGSGVYDCWAEFQEEWGVHAYVTWVTVAILVIPFILLTLAYGRICQVVWRSMRNRERSVKAVKPNRGVLVTWTARRTPIGGSEAERQSLNDSSCQNGTHRNNSSNPRAHVQGLSRAKVKTIKLTLTVIICYFLCWAPFFIAQLLSVWDPASHFNSTSMVIMLLLASLNSCTNPWIYLAFSDSLYRQVARCCRSPKRHLVTTTESRARSTFRSTTTTDMATSVPLNDRSPLSHQILS